jgi:NADH:ubiquinone oxidoreductase subunit E
VTASLERPAFSPLALAEYRELLARYPVRRAALMPTLWLAQREFGWLSQPVMEYVAELMELPLAWVASVASFYTMYWKEP